MYILAIHGSPRKNGNSEILLDFLLKGVSQTLEEFRKQSEVKVEKVRLPELAFSPCRECGGCEIKEECVVEDDFKTFLTPKIWNSDLLIISTPIFFYSHTAYVQAFFERFQAFWARKYVWKLPHPSDKKPKGILLSLGATKGTKLFEGLIRSYKYVMDAIYGSYVGGLFFRSIEKKGDILNFPEILDKAQILGKEIISVPQENWSLNRDPCP